jgi:hypothetical protein
VLQVVKGLAAERVRDATQANGETFNRGAVCAVKFASQYLPGDVKPGRGVGWQVMGLGFDQGKERELVLA